MKSQNERVSEKKISDIESDEASEKEEEKPRKFRAKVNWGI